PAPAPTHIFSLSLHDALPISTNVFGSLLGIVAFFAASWFRTSPHLWFLVCGVLALYFVPRWSALQVVSLVGLLFIAGTVAHGVGDRKSTRLNSSHDQISYAVF